MKPFCADWPPDRVAEVVNHIVAVTLKYDRITTRSVAIDTGFSERMIVQLNEIAERNADVRDVLR